MPGKSVITPALRQAAPELCGQMDGLRKERKTAVERRCWLTTTGKEDEVVTVQQRIDAIDAEVATLHAAAKEQILKGTATNLSQQAALLDLVDSDRKTLRSTIKEKIERNAEELKELLAADADMDCAVEQSISAMNAAARQIAYCTEEQEGADEATPTLARSSADKNKSTPFRRRKC